MQAFFELKSLSSVCLSIYFLKELTVFFKASGTDITYQSPGTCTSLHLVPYTMCFPSCLCSSYLKLKFKLHALENLIHTLTTFLGNEFLVHFHRSLIYPNVSSCFLLFLNLSGFVTHFPDRLQSCLQFRFNRETGLKHSSNSKFPTDFLAEGCEAADLNWSQFGLA